MVEGHGGSVVGGGSVVEPPGGTVVGGSVEGPPGWVVEVVVDTNRLVDVLDGRLVVVDESGRLVLVARVVLVLGRLVLVTVGWVRVHPCRSRRAARASAADPRSPNLA